MLSIRAIASSERQVIRAGNNKNAVHSKWKKSMAYQLPEIQHDGDEQDLLIYKRYETSSDKPYRFITLSGYHPGTEVCLGFKSVENVRHRLKPGLRFVLCRTKEDEDGYMLICGGVGTKR